MWVEDIIGNVSHLLTLLAVGSAILQFRVNVTTTRKKDVHRYEPVEVVRSRDLLGMKHHITKFQPILEQGNIQVRRIILYKCAHSDAAIAHVKSRYEEWIKEGRQIFGGPKLYQGTCSMVHFLSWTLFEGPEPFSLPRP